MDLESSPKQKKKKIEPSSEPETSFIDYNAVQPIIGSKAEPVLESDQVVPGGVDPAQNGSNPPQKQTILYNLFSPETRLGHFMRPAIRNTASYIVAFAIGLFCAYFLLFVPASKEVEKLKAEFVSTSRDLQTSQEQLGSLQKRFDLASADLERANRRASYMQLLSNVSRARLALAEKDGPSALVVLKEVEVNLKALNPAIVKVDANMAQLLNTRLELVMTELNRDPVTAVSDLEKLYSSLLELEKALLK
jgi:hypothetical protein